MCPKCGNIPMPNNKLCEYHWYRNAAVNSTNNADNADKLKSKLELQDFKCYYTNIHLTPGVNASVEHIKPTSEYPELIDNMDNIVWCHMDVNYMKRSLSVERFIELCRLIVDNSNT
jgi:hypothetical protein